MYSFEHMNAYFLRKKSQHSSSTMYEKNILLPLFYNKYFIHKKIHNGSVGPKTKNTCHTLLTFSCSSDLNFVMIIQQFLEKSDIWEVIPQTANNIRISRALCSDNSVTQDVCISVSGILGGYDPLQFNKVSYPLKFRSIITIKSLCYSKQQICLIFFRHFYLT